MDIAKYRALFVSETREYLQGMSDRILKFGDSPSSETLDWLFRAAHSIKGMAASLGYEPLSGLAHRMETGLDGIKKGQLQFDQNMEAIFLHGMDLIESMLNSIERGDDPVELATNMLEARIQDPSEPPPEARRENSRFLYKLEWTINSQADASKAVMNRLLSRIEKLGRVSRLISAASSSEPSVCYLVTSHPAAFVEESLRELRGLLSVSVTPVDPRTRQSPEAETTAVFESSDESFRFKTVRVDTGKIDRIIEGLGELLIHHTQLQEANPEDEELLRLRVLAQEIYFGACDLRMLPFETISARFPRIVHDLGKKLGKKIQLAIEGAGIQIDKAILAEIADPLIHVLRNAVAHGIEPPAVRLSTGKAEVGRISISVSKRSDRLVIAVEDDGRGLDAQTVKNAAIENRIVARSVAELLNQQELLLLITRPGFSTASALSEISGRGVGLDAVRDRIDSLGGELLLFSKPGEFTRFEFVLPFTLAVLPVLLFRLERAQFAVPLSRVDRVTQLKRSEIQYTHGRPMIYDHDRTISVESISALIFGGQETFPDEFPAFITKHQNREIAWAVDELLEEKEILLKLLGEPLNQIPFYAGATILSNGEVVPVLEMEQLYRERYG